MVDIDASIRQSAGREPDVLDRALRRLAVDIGPLNDLLSGLQRAAVQAIQAAKQQLSSYATEPPQSAAEASASRHAQRLLQVLNRLAQDVQRMEQQLQGVHDRILSAACAHVSPISAEDTAAGLLARLRVGVAGGSR
jgi:hypothetical protein